MVSKSQNNRDAEKQIDRNTVETFLKDHFQQGEVAELRVLGYRPDDSGKTENLSGYYDRFDLLAKDAIRFSRQAYGIYFTINPLKPEVLKKWKNRENKIYGSPKGESARDEDILLRRWLVVDIDSIREDQDASATDKEKESAWEVVENVIGIFNKELKEKPTKIIDSGNGYHLYYRLADDFPLDDTHPTDRGNVINLVLGTLAEFGHFNGLVNIDTTVSNLSRIMRLPGTFACKGKDTKERPWRKSRVIGRMEFLHESSQI